MSRFIESVRCEKGRLHNLFYHQERLNNTRKLMLGISDILDLKCCVTIPACISDEKFKCRIVYSDTILSVQFLKYEMQKIHSLKLVFQDDIDYTFKCENRSALDALTAKKGNADDIIIVKNGLITDSSYANLVFFDGSNWYTPSEPLLKGTMRHYLIDSKIISTAQIKIGDIKNFQSVRLINAMMDFHECPQIDIELIS